MDKICELINNNFDDLGQELEHYDKLSDSDKMIENHIFHNLYQSGCLFVESQDHADSCANKIESMLNDSDYTGAAYMMEKWQQLDDLKKVARSDFYKLANPWSVPKDFSPQAEDIPF